MPIFRFPFSHDDSITQISIFGDLNPPSKASGIAVALFQLCKKSNPPLPCTPVVCMPWIKGKKDFKVKNELALLNICIVPCMLGGIIKIKSK